MNRSEPVSIQLICSLMHSCVALARNAIPLNLVVIVDSGPPGSLARLSSVPVLMRSSWMAEFCPCSTIWLFALRYDSGAVRNTRDLNTKQINVASNRMPPSPWQHDWNSPTPNPHPRPKCEAATLTLAPNARRPPSLLPQVRACHLYTRHPLPRLKRRVEGLLVLSLRVNDT